MITAILSPTVAQAVTIAIDAGNAVDDMTENWSNARQVITMKRPLTPAVRDAIARAVPSLRYWTATGTPHDAPSEGFTSDRERVGLSFPAEQGARWAL